MPQHHSSAIGGELNDDTSFGSVASFSVSNPFTDSSSDAGFETTAEHHMSADRTALSDHCENSSAISNHSNGAASSAANTETIAFNPFAGVRTMAPAFTDLKDFAPSMLESKQKSNCIDYGAIRATLSSAMLNDVGSSEAVASAQETRTCDKAAMDFFEDAATAAFNQFGGKTNSSFNVRTVSPRPNAAVQNGYDGSAFNGKVILTMEYN